ncbi:MAG: NAD(P)/FAD-dependent oxidoreductase [Oscillospiraceae bacterium]|jgi:predicted Rossmann fold flavoprotein|nr:NAD(P)/FAD-dependent oxidoreductase [Oscillospiraceae bacterium]
MKYDVIIIGGGAAGSFAALQLLKRQKKVLLLEQNNFIGKKLGITGKGRCNLTNNSSVDEHLQNIPHNSRFLYSAYSKITPQNVINIFEELGVSLKTERGKRVFPVTDKAKDVVEALDYKIRELGVKFQGRKVTEILVSDKEKSVCGVKCGEMEYFSDYVILATGGVSYPQTGSDGSGMKMAKELGHSIIKLSPSLVPVECEEVFCNNLMGVTLKNVVLTVKTKSNRRVFSEQGEMLFTHYGVSGPMILSASAHMLGEANKYKMDIDLKPALSAERLDDRIRRDFDKNLNRAFKNSLNDLLPKRLIETIIELSGISPDKKVNVITKEERTKLCKLMKSLSLTPKAFRPLNEAIITRGGIDVREIDPKTMQSKLIKGLYFAGEIIDVDAYTGGFNLQIAFATAYVASLLN